MEKKLSNSEQRISSKVEEMKRKIQKNKKDSERNEKISKMLVDTSIKVAIVSVSISCLWLIYKKISN
ncbi:hypothetical protein H8356DRAFT_1632776 [Neocallimastix lanati (nom. inval.)]|nr:hypothetical protein H8356DRAFT_1632776 [Neocallimastix sp. JGI-2020a]